MAPQADYERTTHATRVDALPPPLRTAVDEHAILRSLTVPVDAPAFVTTNRRLRRPGILARMTGTADRDAEHQVALVLGARDVLVATYGAERGVAVLSARLEDVDVGSLAEGLRATGLADAVADAGVTVSGFATSVEGHAARGSFFVGLGPPDGEVAAATLREAVRVAKGR